MPITAVKIDSRTIGLGVCIKVQAETGVTRQLDCSWEFPWMNEPVICCSKVCGTMMPFRGIIYNTTLILNTQPIKTTLTCFCDTGPV